MKLENLIVALMEYIGKDNLIITGYYLMEAESWQLYSGPGPEGGIVLERRRRVTPPLQEGLFSLD